MWSNRRGQRLGWKRVGRGRKVKEEVKEEVEEVVEEKVKEEAEAEVVEEKVEVMSIAWLRGFLANQRVGAIMEMPWGPTVLAWP